MVILNDREGWEAAYRSTFLDHWQRTGKLDWKAYPRLRNEPLPSSSGVDLAESRLLLISTAGGYLSDSQQPFDAANPLGDYTIRTFPTDTPFEAIAYSHEHYDHTAVNADPEVLLPLPALASLRAEGSIGQVTPSVVSFMGYQPDLTRVLDETIPEISRVAAGLEATAALLVPA